MENQQLIEALQSLVTGLSQQADGHELQAVIFAHEGYAKLATHYTEHAAEERGYVKAMAEKIMDLGGIPENAQKPATPVYKDPIDWIKYDQQISVDGLKYLKSVMDMAQDYVSTYKVLEEYYADEQEDLVWARKQLALIETLGKQYWYFYQL